MKVVSTIIDLHHLIETSGHLRLYHYHSLLHSHISMFTLHDILIPIPLTCMCDPCLHLHQSYHPMSYMCICMLGGDFRSYCHVIYVPHTFHMLCTHYCQTHPYVAPLVDTHGFPRLHNVPICHELDPLDMHNYHHISPCVARTMTHNIVFEVAPIASSLLLGDHDMSYVLHDPNPIVHNMLPSHRYALAPHHNAYSHTSCIPHDTHNTYHFMTDDMFLYHASNFFEISLACTNTPVTIHIMMDDVYVYHTHNLFPFSCCVGPHVSPSTSATHELEIRALESTDEDFIITLLPLLDHGKRSLGLPLHAPPIAMGYALSHI